MSSNDRKRKRPKSYYLKSAKQSRSGKQSTWQTLGVGMKGFLMTCNFREKDCVREAYNLLNQYADEMYGPEEGFLKDKKKGDDVSDDEDDDDLEAALKKEVQEIKDVKPKDRRFQVVDTGAKNCIFVRTTVEDPVKLVHKIMSDVYESKECKVRQIQRLMPITNTCKAYRDDINAIMPNILQPHLDKYTNGLPSYCVMFKARNNNNVGRSDVYEVVAEIMMDSRVDTVNADLVVIVEVIKSVCCISVVTDYLKFRKFNMHEIVQRTVDANAVAKKEEDSGKIDKMADDLPVDGVTDPKVGGEGDGAQAEGVADEREMNKKGNEGEQDGEGERDETKDVASVSCAAEDGEKVD